MTKLIVLMNPLIAIGETRDFESFRAILEKATIEKITEKGGSSLFDRVMLFKALVLQNLYGLSDEQFEYQITDRLSFMGFLDLTLADKVPD